MEVLENIFKRSISDLNQEFDNLFDKYGYSHFFKNSIPNLKGNFLLLRKKDPELLVQLGALKVVEESYYEWTDSFKKEAFLSNYAYVIITVIEKLEKKLQEYKLFLSNMSKSKNHNFLESKLEYYIFRIQNKPHYLAYHNDGFRKKEGEYYNITFNNKLDVPYTLTFENDKFIAKLESKIFKRTIPHPYGNILVDVKTWVKMDLSSRMVNILSSFLTDPFYSNQTSGIEENSILPPFKINSTVFLENGEKTFFKILLKAQAIIIKNDKIILTDKIFKGCCGYLYEILRKPSYSTIIYSTTKADFIRYLNLTDTYNAKIPQGSVFTDSATIERQKEILDPAISKFFPKHTKS
ncbi:hypothetical protein ACFSQJ_15960 [Croceitalea marina]|uniref:Uncharacterized protein n=1 Tax=Croceitalea marina TaxID=1775166 RepID=A0ABW5MZI8_9FLAO